MKSIFFSLNNILVDSKKIHEDAFISAVYEHTKILISSHFHDNHLNGLPTRKKLKMLDSIPPHLYDKICDKKQELTIKLIDEKLRADPIKIELLSQLKDLDYKVACVTNSIRKTAKLMLDRIGVLEYIDLLISNEDVSQPKPSSEGYLKALVYFDLSPTECLIVEDNENGLIAANKTGCMVWKVKDSQEVTLSNIRKYLC